MNSIEDRVKEAIARNAVSAQSINVKEVISEKDFLRKFLIACIFFISLAMLFFVVEKNYDLISMIKNRTDDSQVNNSQINDFEDTHHQKISSIENDLEVWSNRLWMLGLANNENNSIRQTIDRKYHPKIKSNYILFDKNWQMSKWPESVRLTDEQKDLLKEHVK